MKVLFYILALMLTLSSCAHAPLPEIGSAPPAKVPQLPATLSQRATALPPITDPSLGGINRDGVETDIRYNALALRFNALLDVYECVRVSLANGNVAKDCLP